MNNKTKIGIMIGTILLFGLLIGYLTHNAIPLRPFPHWGGPPKHFRHKKSLSERFSNLFTKRLLKEINPNEDQKEDVINIIQKYEIKFIKNNDTHIKNMISLFREMEQELDPILTEDQKTEIREKLERMEEGFFRHKEFKEKRK